MTQELKYFLQTLRKVQQVLKEQVKFKRKPNKVSVFDVIIDLLLNVCLNRLIECNSH